MLQFLSSADRSLLQAINQAWAHPWLDAAMPVLTDLHKHPLALTLLLLPALGAWLYRKRGGGVRVLLAAALAVGLTDALSYRLIKPLIRRPRPAQSGVPLTLRAPASGYGMPSNHAANMFAAAQVFGLAEPVLRLPLFALAALVAYSRVYTGVHYPSDVLAGALLGLAVGWGVVWAGRRNGWVFSSERPRTRPPSGPSGSA